MNKILICVGTRPNFIKVTRFKKLAPKFNLEIKLPWPGQMINILNGVREWNKYWNKKNFRLFVIISNDFF